MDSLQDEQPNARPALVPQDLMILDTIRRQFLLVGNQPYAAAVERALKALHRPGEPAAGNAPSDPGGAYIGLTRSSASNAHSMLHQARQRSGPPERLGRSYAIEDSRAPGVNAAHPRKRGAE